jgi:hypothetical protein
VKCALARKTALRGTQCRTCDVCDVLCNTCDLTNDPFCGDARERTLKSGLIRTLRGLFQALLIAACAADAGGAPSAPDYQHDIRPIVERRCLVCHGCYDAPCQLNLDSQEGLKRGASKERVYSSDRLAAATPSRLFADAQSTAQWRAHGFSPVLPDQPDASAADRRAGVLARMLDLEHQNPLPAGKLLPKTFDFSLNRAQQCPWERVAHAVE